MVICVVPYQKLLQSPEKSYHHGGLYCDKCVFSHLHDKCVFSKRV